MRRERADKLALVYGGRFFTCLTFLSALAGFVCHTCKFKNILPTSYGLELAGGVLSFFLRRAEG